MKPISSDQVSILPYFPNEKTKGNMPQPATILPIKQPQLKDDKFFNVTTISTKLVYQSLSIKLANFSDRSTQIVTIPSQNTNESNNRVFDFQAVANNVLSFVGNRLQEAKQQGADDEKMANLFQQARTGIAQGFNEAIEELGEIGLLNDELGENISKSKALIDQGVDTLERNLRPEKFIATGDDSEGLYAASLTSDKLMRQENSSNLSITTADGDIVTISFSDYRESSQSEQLNYASLFDRRGNSNEQYSYRYAQSNYRATSFAFTVEGYLDEGEKKAIEELITNISKIENDFFNGNLDDALNKALSLGFDQKELSAFNLDLKQTTTAVISQRYNDIAQRSNNDHSELTKLTQPLLDFAQQVKSVNTQATELLKHSENDFSKLLNKVFKAEFGNQQEMLARLESFLNKLST